jgi:hypothetical protein
MDYVGLAALIVAVLSALGHFVEMAHIKKIKIGCLESDCMKSPPSTPALKSEPHINSTGC